MKDMYFVWTYTYKDGKEQELKKWLKDVGHPYFKSIPEIRDAKSFLRQFGLGKVPIFQTWLEISDFSSLGFLDRWRNDTERARIFKEFMALIRDWNTSIIREVT